jgi:hypothetical protein
METSLEIRTCKECGAALHGRTDQKYCSGICRTAANNQKRAEEAKNRPDCIASIQKTLLNNYRILTDLRKRGEQFSTMYLQDLGFSFRHITATEEKADLQVNYCHGQAYLLTQDTIRLLI